VVKEYQYQCQQAMGLHRQQQQVLQMPISQAVQALVVSVLVVVLAPEQPDLV
jgi:hypothetical protein